MADGAMRAARLARLGGGGGGSSAGGAGGDGYGGAAAPVASAPAATPAAAAPAAPAASAFATTPAAAAPAAPFRLGIIADVQYADEDDGTDFSGEEHRHFRNALKILKAAVDVWNYQKVDVVVQLGDVIDGLNRKGGRSAEALSTVMREFARCSTSRRYDLIGNHELYNFTRQELATCGLRCTEGEGGVGYHAVRLNENWEAIFLDAYELALIGYPDGADQLEKAKEMMNANNPNVLAQVGGGDWFQGLPVEKHRYVPYNGAVSEAQLKFLRETLDRVQGEKRQALIFTHTPLFEGATKPKTVTWNGEDVLAVLHEFQEAVVAVFAGHDHNGGYAVDDRGIHHVTLNSPLTAEGKECFGILECHEGWAQLVPYGRVCVQTGTSGKGLAYKEMILAKGADNVPV